MILSAQALRAERGRIRFSCDFHYPPDASFDPFDIAVILHNAGANALEAALRTEDPFIRIRSRKRGRAFFIEYANSCSGPLTEDPATGRARSAKKDAEHHGVGLENVVGAAEIYGGACEIWTEGRTCFLTVLLNDAPSRD